MGYIAYIYMYMNIYICVCMYVRVYLCIYMHIYIYNVYTLLIERAKAQGFPPTVSRQQLDLQGPSLIRCRPRPSSSMIPWGPNSPRQVLFMYFRPQSNYCLRICAAEREKEKKLRWT